MISKTVLRWLTLAITQFGVILLAAAVGFIFNPSLLSAAEEDSSAITVALAGDVSPAPGSPTFNVFGAPLEDPFDEPMVASNGNVVFISELSNGFRGIFFKKNNKSASVKLISATDVAIPGAFTPDSYDGPAMSQNGKIAFVARNTGEAVIRVKDPNKGTLEVIAKNGDTAPGTGGAVFFEFDDLAVNDKGNVAFIADYTKNGGITVKAGVFLATKKGIVQIVLNGDALPGTGGTEDALFAEDIDGPWLNNKDDVAFAVDVINAAPSFEGSVFLKRFKKPLESLLLMGTPLLGGTLSSIGVGRPGLNNQDFLAFSGEFTGGTPNAGVGVVVPDKGIVKCVLRGDAAPDTTATFDSIFGPPFGNPTISNNAVAFHSDLLGDAANPRGIFTCAKVGKKLEPREALLVSDPKPTGSWGNPEEDSSSNVWIVFVDEDNPPGPVGVFITKKPGPEPKKDKN